MKNSSPTSNIANANEAVKPPSQKRDVVSDNGQKVLQARNTISGTTHPYNAATLRHIIKDVESENTLLLEQLHTTQEELERQLLERQRLENKFAATINQHATDTASLQKTINSLVNEKDALQKQLEKEIQDCNDNITQLRLTLSEVEVESKIVLNQLHQTQEELERQLLQKNELEKTSIIAKDETIKLKIENKTLTEEKAALDSTTKREISNLDRKREELQTQIKDLENKITILKKNSQETESENKLILSHLHKTQEDLEVQFSRTSEIEAQVEIQRQHIQSMLKSYPSFWSFDELKVSSPNENRESDTLWHFTKFFLGELYFPELRILTTRRNGNVGIIFLRSDIQSPTPLLRWPSSFSEALSLPCIPEHGSALQGNNATLSALSTRDWTLLQTLVQRLINLLEIPANVSFPSTLNTNELRKELLKFNQVLRNWPPIMRYDRLSLHSTESVENYQSLTFELQNISMADHHWPQLLYSLATVDEEGQSFGGNPRLEFPQSTRHALRNWFPESDDIRGSRLELRFAKPADMDLNVWNQLATEDQLLIVGLLSILPLQLSEIQHAFPPKMQSVKDWSNLAKTMRKILATQTRLYTREV